MRKINYILFLISLLVVASCSKDFLDRSSKENISTGSFYKTSDDAIAAINAAYNPLMRQKLYNLRIWSLDIVAGNSEVGGDPSNSNDGSETKNMANFATATDNASALDIWRGPWPGIQYCNIVLDKVPSIEMDSALKQRILGEAEFLRGMYYFILVRLFGDVPLITKPYWGYADEDTRPHRIDKSLIYEQIISDFSDALVKLPLCETYSGDDVGRASKGSAAGMLAKVYLTLGKTASNWERVVSLCDTLATWGYDLNEDYSTNFDPENENSIESVFEIQYKGNSTDAFADDSPASLTTNYMGPRGAVLTTCGAGWDQPTQEFVDSYEEGDLRKDKTIFYEGCPLFDGKEYKSSYAHITGYLVRKYIVPGSYIKDWNNGSPLNFPVLRYADVLLMKAEALNELDRTEEAEIPLNLVRSRAGLIGVKGLSKSDFREKVLHERRIELAFEGDRWFDLVRINDGQYALDFLHSIGKTSATSKHLLLPVPQIDIDANPNLLPNNPGY
jgi:starch-binding outer membrane protein, SusD/RagB family